MQIVLVSLSTGARAQVPSDYIRMREFIYTSAPFPSAHASTIVETPTGTLLAAWFGGTSEGHDDVEIWLSRRPMNGSWSTPERVTHTPNIAVWNPVLFQAGDTTWLFFKAGPSPREWVGGYRRSADAGETWDDVVYLPAGLLGPVRTKPIVLADQTWLAGTSVEAGYRADTPADAPYRSWAVWVERSTDRGKTWSKHGPITAPAELYGVIQPTLWQTRNGEIRMLMRSTGRIGRIVMSTSHDGGRTWMPAHLTNLPNPNAGIDVVRLRDERLLLIYNHLTRGRNAIHMAVSHDDGENWSTPILLEEGPGEYSYPAAIQSADGAVHITYTWRRTHIRHVVIDASRLP